MMTKHEPTGFEYTHQDQVFFAADFSRQIGEFSETVC